MWKTLFFQNQAHVMPAEDLMLHYLDLDCYCKPQLLYPDNVVRHNSFDKREYFESEPKKKETVN